jgi:hypothetical protein
VKLEELGEVNRTGFGFLKNGANRETVGRETTSNAK